MFNANSSLVKLWSRKVREGGVTLEEVPRLFNLYEEVEKSIVNS